MIKNAYEAMRHLHEVGCEATSKEITEGRWNDVWNSAQRLAKIEDHISNLDRRFQREQPAPKPGTNEPSRGETGAAKIE